MFTETTLLSTAASLQNGFGANRKDPSLNRGNPTLSTRSNKACVLQRPGVFEIEERAAPGPCSARDVVVRIIATGLCGSDVHFWKHGRIGQCVVTSPIVLGHESAGIIESCGPEVKGLAVGDRVAVEPGIACHICEACRRGKYNLCASMRFAATPPYDGTLSTFYRVPEECCFKLPHHISFEEGALVEPLSVGVHCCKLAEINPSKTLVVFGAGPIGLLCCAVAQAFGVSRIIVADILESRLEFAQAYIGVTTYLIGRGGGGAGTHDFCAAAMLAQLGAPDGSDVVMDATGVESCISYGMQVLRRGGIFIQAGLGPTTINFPIALLCDKEATYQGSFRYGPGDYKTAVQLLGSGKVRVKKLITHRYAFADTEKAFVNASNRQGIKTVIYGPDVAGPSALAGGVEEAD